MVLLMKNLFYSKICSGNIEPVKKSIKIAAEMTHVELTVLLIDNLNTDKNELISMFKWIKKIDNTIPVHLSRYFPRYFMNLKKYDIIYAHRKRTNFTVNATNIV